jgi:hypothetical protein
MRRFLIKSYTGHILLLGTGLGNDEFGGACLYVNNNVFKWVVQSRAYTDLQDAVFIKINRNTKQIEMVEHEYLQARLVKDAATGFWVYVRKAPPGVKIKQEFDLMIPLSNPFDIYTLDKPIIPPPI